MAGLTVDPAKSVTEDAGEVVVETVDTEKLANKLQAINGWFSSA